MTLMSERASDRARSIVTERQKTSFCHVIYSGGEKICAPTALWHNQKRHRAPGSVKFRTGGHSPRTAPAGRQKIVRIFASAQDAKSTQDAKTPLEMPARKRGRTGENPVPTVQSGWKVARAENGRSPPLAEVSAAPPAVQRGGGRVRRFVMVSRRARGSCPHTGTGASTP